MTHAHPTPPDGGVGTGASGGRPALRGTDSSRDHGAAFDAAHVLTPAQGKVLRALAACRTAALGGHLEVCDQCGFERPAYNSCRNRHCPGCQAAAQREWLENRLVRVLPTHHFHVVFTLPSELRELALRNGAVVYDVLERAAAEVLGTLADDRLHAQLGVTAVLHTWTRQMLFHPHVHCVVTGGGLARDGDRWVGTPRHFLFPVAVMRKLYRGVVRAWLRAAFDDDRLAFDGDARAFARLLRSIHRKNWVVYAKPPFAGAKQVFAYLGRYTHRVAISDHRLLAVTSDTVTFTTRDGGRVAVAPEEFIRRFLLHVLPTGFHEIRHFGLYAAANVHTRLEQARARLPAAAEAVSEDAAATTSTEAATETRTCPCCKVGVLLRLPLPHARPASPQPAVRLDSS